MPVDDLPMYPTPQQAAYVVHDSPPRSSRKHQPIQKHSNHGYAPPQQQSSNLYHHLQPHITQSGYSQQHSLHAPPPSAPQQHQPSPYQHPTHYLHQLGVQNNQPQLYYSQPPGAYSQQYNTPAAAPTPQQQYYQSQQAPVAPKVSNPPQQVYQTQQRYHSQEHIAPQHGAPVQQAPSQQRYQSLSQAQPLPYSSSAPLSNSGHLQKKPPAMVNRSKESLPDSSSGGRQVSSSRQKLEVELRSVFEKVDINRSGRISAKELSMALVNFDHTRFQDSTIGLMINLFSSPTGNAGSPSNSLTFDQFVSLWKYLSAYKKLFLAADSNKSGDISFGELQKIIEQIGYNLNIDLVLHLFQKFSQKGRENSTVNGISVGKLKFDAFIELLVYLRKLTDVFKKYDKDLSGVATIGFLDFLFEVSNLT